MRTVKNLKSAKKIKNDGYYTQLVDIELELKHYTEFFKNKVIYCNCDDPRSSNFVKYFVDNFARLGLKKLIASCYESQQIGLFIDNSKPALYLEWDGKGNVKDKIKKLKGNGDFRSLECINLLKQSDIVVTNPPFSLSPEYFNQLVKHNKKFLILGSLTSLTNNKIIDLIKDNKLQLGYLSKVHNLSFDVTVDHAKYLVENKKENSSYIIVDGIVKAMTRCCWYSTLDLVKEYKDFVLTKSYKDNEGYCKYDKYDNYDIINVNSRNDIPMDYAGIIGVPISFFEVYSPHQFEILGSSQRLKEWVHLKKIIRGDGMIINTFTLFDKICFKRILIKNKRLQTNNK